MRKTSIVGWLISLTGTGLWSYAYFVTGHPPFIEWHANTPWWIADLLPNAESEIGMALAFAGIVQIYRPLPR